MHKENSTLHNAIVLSSLFVGLLWLVKLCELSFGWHLGVFGVRPHSINGLFGIFTAPLIHGSIEHLLANTLPTLLLGSILLYGYPRSRWWALSIIWVSAGIGVWTFGRENYHIGASGLTHGIFFFLFISGILRRDKRSIGLLMIAFFMYGTMLLTIFPRDPGISFESHFFGAVGGIISALLFRYWDPKPVKKLYSWDLESVEDADNDIIGDSWKPTDQRDIESEEANPR